MANRKLNSIKFPDIADKYILDADKVNYDDSETYASGSVGKALQNKADVAGTYSELTSGTAETILSDSTTENITPYSFRKTPVNADREYLDKVVGGSVAFNQLCNGSSVTVPNGHKYYMIKGGTASIETSSGSAITGLTSGTDIVIDLTQMFGSTVADAIYAMETATAGSGVAYLKSVAPKMFSQYNAYDAGSIKSVEATAHKTVGFNAWDEEWRNGFYNASTGVFSPYNEYVANANPIKVLPNTEYYINVPSGVSRTLFFYDADGGFLSKTGTASGATLFETPNNCYYVCFYLGNSYGTTYNHDICINISDTNRNGTYEPYVKHSYALDSSLTLRGVPKLDASNNLYYDGDTYESDGTVTRRFGEYVFTGNETWVQAGSSYYTRQNILAKRPPNDNSVANITSVLMPTYANALYNGTLTSGIAIDSVHGDIYIGSADYANRASLTGKSLVYELATPTTETADPFANVQICDGDGTEEFVSNSIVPTGHSTRYAKDIKSVLEDIADAPSTNGTYILKATVSASGTVYEWVAE